MFAGDWGGANVSMLSFWRKGELNGVPLLPTMLKSPHYHSAAMIESESWHLHPPHEKRNSNGEL